VCRDADKSSTHWYEEEVVPGIPGAFALSTVGHVLTAGGDANRLTQSYDKLCV